MEDLGNFGEMDLARVSAWILGVLSGGIREDDEVEKVGTPQSVVREIDVGMGVQVITCIYNLNSYLN